MSKSATKELPTKDPANQLGYGLVSTLISIIFGIIMTTLVLRLVFRLLGANPDASFVNWIYSFTAPLVAPFFGIFNENALNLTTGHLEIGTILALLVYGLIGGVLERATSWGGWHHSV
jgi:uncharacterized protein YggT (Ycf19 family)